MCSSLRSAIFGYHSGQFEEASLVAKLKEAQAQGKGAASLDGKMIDAASEKMARNLLATAAAIKSAEAARAG